MSDIDNIIHFDDDEDEADKNSGESSQTCECKECQIIFSIGDKGSSSLKELCAKCHAKENARLLAELEDGEQESVGK